MHNKNNETRNEAERSKSDLLRHDSDILYRASQFSSTKAARITYVVML